MSKLGIFAALAMTVAFASTSQAAPATFTETGVLSGSLNGVSFTNANVTLTSYADTTNIVSGNFGGSVPYNDLIASTTTILIQGFSLATFNGGDNFGVFE